MEDLEDLQNFNDQKGLEEDLEKFGKSNSKQL